MTEPKQDLLKDRQEISPLAKDMTYGEKAYDLVFNNLINFWVNLITSGLFVYWTAHSKTPLKNPFNGKELAPPRIFQQKIAKAIHDSAPLNVFGNKGDYNIHNPPETLRSEAANTITNVFTLNTSAHFLLIPSVWLGAKIKAPMVEWLNRKHYGDEAMEDPSLKYRHAMIRLQERPTFLGTVLGRAGSIVASGFTGYAIGSSKNAINWVGNKFNIPGLRSFRGVDFYAETLGNHAGMVVTDVAPDKSAKFDNFLREKNYGYSSSQVILHPELKNKTYEGATKHIGKYMAQDVLYTIVTSNTIGPAINILKKFIPGMTYKPKDAEAERVVRETEDMPKMRIRPNQIMEVANENLASANENRPELPGNQITSARRLDRVADAAQEVSV